MVGIGDGWGGEESTMSDAMSGYLIGSYQIELIN